MASVLTGSLATLVAVPALSCAIFTHLVLFLTVFLMFIFIFNWPNPSAPTQQGVWKFNWHPVFMVSAFVLFMGEAIISYRLLPFDPRTQKRLHMFLQTLALISSSAGIYCMVSFHNDNDYPHFYNIHSLIGMSTFVIFCVQYIGGFMAFFFPGLQDSRRAAVMPYHKYVGIVLFFLAWIAMLTGLMNRQRLQFAEPFIAPYRMANAMGAFIVLGAVCIIFHFSPAAREKEHQGGDAERLL
jgi:cytochrome b-561